MAEKKIYTHLDMMNASRIVNLPEPQGNEDPVRLADLQSAIENLNWKDNCRVATQANLNLSSPGGTIDGVAMSSGDRVLVRNQTAASANGIYIWNGAASAMVRAADASTANELESAKTSVDEGSDAQTSWRQTAVNFTLGTNNIVWATFATDTPTASETVQGKAEIATQAETNTGTDDTRMLTPYKAKNAYWALKRHDDIIGDGVNTSFVVTHNLGSKYVHVSLYESASPFSEVEAEIQHTSDNSVTVLFSVEPGEDAVSIFITR